MSWLNPTDSELDWGVYHAGEALCKLHKEGQFDEVFVKGRSTGAYMAAWKMYDEAVSQQRRGWPDKKYLVDTSISFMLHSANQGDIDGPKNQSTPKEIPSDAQPNQDS